jgi:hypothetical protein
MFRRLINLLTALSLLMCVAASALWVRSYDDGHIFFRSHFRDQGRWTFRVRDELRVARGVIVYTRSVGSGSRDGYRAMVETTLRAYPDPPPHERTTIQKAVPKRRPPDPSFCGFAFYHHAYVRKDGPPCSETHRVTIPIWSLTALAATPPALGGIGFCWKRRRGARGLCTTCAYDLTGNESGVCPECGTAACARSAEPQPLC